jgi:hypothetical protein
MNKQSLCGDMNSRTKENTKLMARWTGLWLVSLALLSFGPKFLWDYSALVTLPLLVVNLFIGFKMIWANKVHLEGLDEMQQRIMLEAMAISLGSTMVIGAVYGLLYAIRLIPVEPNASGLLFVMGISYIIGTLVSRKRYL